MTDAVLVLTTVGSAELGEAIAAALVAERLAACVSISAPMTSTYRWQGAIERATEHQLVIKTTMRHVPALTERLKELHAYELPELLVIPIAEGGADYLDWIRRETSPSGSE